jgi:hypothetical protein
MVMSPIGDANAGWNGARENLAARRLSLQKPCAISGLRPGLDGDASADDRSSGNRETENLHRSGTGASVPFRHDCEINAPRLSSTFVAQLLGQILPDTGADKLQARTAYGFDEPVTSLLLDTRL